MLLAHDQVPLDAQSARKKFSQFTINNISNYAMLTRARGKNDGKKMPKTIHAQLATRAKTEGASLNAIVLTFIAQGLGRKEGRA